MEINKDSLCPKCGKVCNPWKVVLRHLYPQKRGPKVRVVDSPAEPLAQ
jgi:hypothetical protein